MKFRFFALFLLPFTFNSCLIENETKIASLVPSVTVDNTNAEEFLLDDQVVTIGTAKFYYFEDEKVRFFVKNLPSNHKVKVNGIFILPNPNSGTFIYEPLLISGYRRNNIQVYDSRNKKVIEHELEFHWGKIKPFLKSEHGNFLFQGIPSRINVSNVAMSCPSIIISSEHGEILEHPDGSYSVLAHLGMKSVKINLQTAFKNFVYQFQVVDPPPPKFYFTVRNKNKCVHLSPSALFKSIEYKIVEIKTKDLNLERTIDFRNSNCIPLNANLTIEKIVYSIGKFGSLYTLDMV